MDSTNRLLVPYDDTRAALGGTGRTTLYELVEHGELTKVNIGRRGFITAESLAAYVDRLTEAAGASPPTPAPSADRKAAVAERIAELDAGGSGPPGLTGATSVGGTWNTDKAKSRDAAINAAELHTGGAV